MSFSNATRFAALDVPMPDHTGRDVVIAILKGTFSVLADGRVVPSDEQAPVRINDELYHPDSAEGSIRLPTDVCVAKHGTDVIVVGEAIRQSRSLAWTSPCAYVASRCRSASMGSGCSTAGS